MAQRKRVLKCNRAEEIELGGRYKVWFKDYSDDVGQVINMSCVIEPTEDISNTMSGLLTKLYQNKYKVDILWHDKPTTTGVLYKRRKDIKCWKNYSLHGHLQGNEKEREACLTDIEYDYSKQNEVLFSFKNAAAIEDDM